MWWVRTRFTTYIFLASDLWPFTRISQINTCGTLFLLKPPVELSLSGAAKPTVARGQDALVADCAGEGVSQAHTPQGGRKHHLCATPTLAAKRPPRRASGKNILGSIHFWTLKVCASPYGHICLEPLTTFGADSRAENHAATQTHAGKGWDLEDARRDLMYNIYVVCIKKVCVRPNMRWDPARRRDATACPGPNVGEARHIPTRSKDEHIYAADSTLAGDPYKTDGCYQIGTGDTCTHELLRTAGRHSRPGFDASFLKPSSVEEYGSSMEGKRKHRKQTDIGFLITREVSRCRWRYTAGRATTESLLFYQ